MHAVSATTVSFPVLHSAPMAEPYGLMSAEVAGEIVDRAERLHAQTPHKKHPWGHYLLWAGGIAAASLAALPYLAPTLFGSIGQLAAIDSFSVCAAKAVNFGADATGLWAPAVQGFLAAIPGLGFVAAGGWAAVGVSVAISLGGHFLAKHLEKKEAEHPGQGIKWSKVVRTVALGSSLLISLPGILTGVSMGLQFLASLATEPAKVVAAHGGNAAVQFIHAHADTLSHAADWSWNHLGGVGMVEAQKALSVNTATYMLPCLASCIVPIAAAGTGGSHAAAATSGGFAAREWARADAAKHTSIR